MTIWYLSFCVELILLSTLPSEKHPGLPERLFIPCVQVLADRPSTCAHLGAHLTGSEAGTHVEPRAAIGIIVSLPQTSELEKMQREILDEPPAGGGWYDRDSCPQPPSGRFSGKVACLDGLVSPDGLVCPFPLASKSPPKESPSSPTNALTTFLLLG